MKNAQQAYDRAVTLMKTQAGTQKTLDDAEAALRTAQARLNSAQTRLTRRKVFSPVAGPVQQIYFRVGEMVPAGKAVVALLPPGNLKVRFFVNEAMLPQAHARRPGQGSLRRLRRRHYRQDQLHRALAEFTPPVIYSLEERSKLVFLIEARTDHARAAARRPAGQRHAGAEAVTAAPKSRSMSRA